MTTDPNKENLFDELDIDDEFDPLAIPPLDDDEDEDVHEDAEPTLSPSRAVPNPRDPKPEIVDTRTDAEKITDLFKAMPTHRRTLLGILEFCLEKQTIPAVAARIEELDEYEVSVYKAANYNHYLAKAGAIVRIDINEENMKDIKVEPVLIEEDGVEYYIVGTPPEAFWLTTEEGKKYLEADDPLGRLRELFEKEQKFLPIYKQVLELCSADGGASIVAMGKLIDDNPLIQKPRMYVNRFVEFLEQRGALVWKKPWRITAIGQIGLEEIARYEEAAKHEQAEAGDIEEEARLLEEAEKAEAETPEAVLPEAETPEAVLPEAETPETAMPEAETLEEEEVNG